jgi:hypothetical protein
MPVPAGAYADAVIVRVNSAMDAFFTVSQSQSMPMPGSVGA